MRGSPCARHPLPSRAALFLACVLLCACTSAPPLRPTAELTTVPFNPQTELQCGPAALATVLQFGGVATTPAQLRASVFTPGLRGSLQSDLVGATRRAGRIAYRLRPTAEALRAELQGGRPVLVLLNQRLDSWPAWHYAVAIGVASQGVVLRSGDQPRVLLPWWRFERGWALADRWAMTALNTDQLPAADDPDGYAQALAGYEQLHGAEAVLSSYQAAVGRWPQHANLRFALANARVMVQDLAGAERDYRAALCVDNRHVAAMNNLADLLMRRGHPDEAKDLIDAAVRRLGDGTPAASSVIGVQVLQTQREIHERAEREPAR